MPIDIPALIANRRPRSMRQVSHGADALLTSGRTLREIIEAFQCLETAEANGVLNEDCAQSLLSELAEEKYLEALIHFTKELLGCTAVGSRKLEELYTWICDRCQPDLRVTWPDRFRSGNRVEKRDGSHVLTMPKPIPLNGVDLLGVRQAVDLIKRLVAEEHQNPTDSTASPAFQGHFTPPGEAYVGQFDAGLPNITGGLGTATSQKATTEQLAAFGEKVQAPFDKIRLHIDDIDSFDNVRNVSPQDVAPWLDQRGYLSVLEEDIQKALEEVLGIPIHQKDWGGEDEDLYTSNVIVNGRRVTTAFLLKGRGMRSKCLRIGNCDKNGSQLVRLFQSPAELFVVQFVGTVHQEVAKFLEEGVQLRRVQGKPASFCIIDGQDTARLLQAYGGL